MTDNQDVAFVEYVVKQLVENAEAVKVERTVDEMGVLIKLTVDQNDMGRVIGKEGRTAKAIRTLLRVIGAKGNARINLKIMEPDGREVPVNNDDNDRGYKGDAEIESANETPVEKPEEKSDDEEQATEVL